MTTSRRPATGSQSSSTKAAPSLAPEARWESLTTPALDDTPLAGQLEIAAEDAGDERLILAADAPPPAEALSSDWRTAEGRVRLPFDPDAFLFDVSPLPEWLGGHHR